MTYMIKVPRGVFAVDEDAAAAKRREIMERLKNGQPVNITPSGHVVEPSNPEVQTARTLKAPEGKLA